MRHVLQTSGFLIRRLLFALALIGLSILAFRGIVLPIVQGTLGVSEAQIAPFRRVGVLAALLFGYGWYVRLLEKRPVNELRPVPLQMLTGGALGAGLLLLGLMPLFAVGAYSVVSGNGMQPDLWRVATLILCAAMLEEVLYRGVLLQALESAWGTRAAVWAQAGLFGVLHIFNLDDRTDAWQIIATAASVTLLGVMWAQWFLLKRNLWVSGLNHAAWNFTILCSGVPLSGSEEWQRIAPLTSVSHGPDWLTGGEFGPENSIVVIACVAAMVWAMHRRLEHRSQVANLATGVTFKGE